ncbi:MAG: lipoprotein [Stagnimonas sp.]|nr:lipoprotein [Stagnimonas sp.]
MKTLPALAAALLLAACGQTGPLRLPEPKKAASADAPAPAAEDAAEQPKTPPSP